MFEQLKNAIQSSLKVNVGNKHKNDHYTVTAQDVNPASITKGWALTYYPKFIQDERPRFYDGKNAFTSLVIANFSAVHELIMGLDQRFAAGDQVQAMAGRQRAIYEMQGVRCTAMRWDKNKVVAITLTITQPESPFYMLQVDFRITDSNKDGRRYMIGSDQMWDRNANSFTEENAMLAPNKLRMLKVFQESSDSIPYVKALARPGALEGTTEIDASSQPFVYVQDVSDKWRAMAYLYEATIMEITMEQALQIVMAQQPSQDPAPNQTPFGGSAFNNGQGFQAPGGQSQQQGFHQPNQAPNGFSSPQNGFQQEQPPAFPQQAQSGAPGGYPPQHGAPGGYQPQAGAFGAQPPQAGAFPVWGAQ